jgi:hypothetical protein
VKKLRALWASLWEDVDRRVRMGRILGLAFIVLGFAVIAKAWDGAASQQFVQQMIPYLLSGGFMGLGLVVLGSVLLFLATIRAERAVLTDRYEQMATLLSRNLSRLAVSANGAGSTGEQVVAGATAYHRPGCRVLEGKDNLMTVSVEQAEAEGLEACRVCDPPKPPPKVEEQAAGETQPEGAETTSAGGLPAPVGTEPASAETETPNP